MLREIEITNFKAIGKTVKIPIRPITLLFGENSAGKSSIIQCILMIIQSVENEWNEILMPRGKYTDVINFKNLIYKHDTSNEFSIKFTIEINEETMFFVDDTSTEEIELGEVAKKFKNSLSQFETAGITLTFKHDESKKNAAVRNKIEMFLGSNIEPLLSYYIDHKGLILNYSHPYWLSYMDHFGDYIIQHIIRCFNIDIEKVSIKILDKIIELLDNTKSEYLDDLNIEIDALLSRENMLRKTDILDINQDYARNVSFLNALYVENKKAEKLLKIYFYGDDYMFFFTDGIFPKETTGVTLKEWIGIKHDEKNITFDKDMIIHPGILVLIFGRRIREALSRGLTYVGPIRNLPERYYATDYHQNSECHFLYNNPEVLSAINQELKNLNANYLLDIVKMSGDQKDVDDIFQLIFVDLVTNTRVNIKDVGFGFSQILPIVFKSIMTSGQRIVIEQPELHLHPAMQAEMADILIRSTKGSGHKYDSPEKKYCYFGCSNTFLIETHSEHLILRLLRRVRETSNNELPSNVPGISPNDISVNYVQQCNAGAEVTHIPITRDGEFSRPWPQGFFAQRAKELF